MAKQILSPVDPDAHSVSLRDDSIHPGRLIRYNHLALSFPQIEFKAVVDLNYVRGEHQHVERDDPCVVITVLKQTGPFTGRCYVLAPGSVGWVSKMSMTVIE